MWNIQQFNYANILLENFTQGRKHKFTIKVKKIVANKFPFKHRHSFKIKLHGWKQETWNHLNVAWPARNIGGSKRTKHWPLTSSIAEPLLDLVQSLCKNKWRTTQRGLRTSKPVIRFLAGKKIALKQKTKTTITIQIWRNVTSSSTRSYFVSKCTRRLLYDRVNMAYLFHKEKNKSLRYQSVKLKREYNSIFLFYFMFQFSE